VIYKGASVLHRCHTGAIATGVGVCTAIGVIATAHANSRFEEVWLK